MRRNGRWTVARSVLARTTLVLGTLPAVSAPAIHAQAPSANAPQPTARFIALAHLEGYRMPAGEPWAPHRPWVLLVKRPGLFLLEADRPNEPPRLLVEAQVLDVAWSPDGRWVAARVRVATSMRGSAARLQFVPAAGGTSEYRVPPARLGPWVWAEDGNVYFWELQSGERMRLDPPRAWRAEYTPPRAPHPWHLRVVADPSARRTRTVLFASRAPGEDPVEKPVPSLTPPQVRSVTLAEAFPSTAPDSARFLVQIQRSGEAGRLERAHTCVIGVHGAPPLQLGAAPQGLPVFAGTSVASDGQWVVGHRAREEGGNLLSSQLWLADSAGRTSVPVEGAASAAASRFSHQGRFLAYEDPTAGGDIVHVGRLDVKLAPAP